MKYHVIYDGNCNLCVTLTQLLEQFDRGELFDYIPMQDDRTLAQFHLTPQDGDAGMIVLEDQNPSHRWQGSDAVEKIAELLPTGDLWMAAYRSIPGLKDVGDQVYAQVRDHRYEWFGKRDSTYSSAYPCQCPPTSDPSTVE
ncbi:DUF393 domain-containing protein [Spirulina sp. CS-785/01]|uniref:thiol-disulfide oxidoreductase DCC family protein n=1 Tax=Spirulina sp. CS-785/01 TaxID=3021716 RepID=UPI00232C3CE3|nr:DUF393 domain-containing protein [Spirulina sp. CS-785/01]MDB9311798.1 DUF393 domain-containing protein [Spirulina sp. CS-785/01]